MKIYVATVLIESNQGNSAYSKVVSTNSENDKDLFRSWIEVEMESILAEWNEFNYPEKSSIISADDDRYDGMLGEYVDEQRPLHITIDIEPKRICI